MRIIIATTAAIAATAVTAGAVNLNMDFADKNDDGVISAREFTRAYGPELDKPTFWYVDKDNNGVIDAAEFAEEAAPAGVLYE